MMPQDQHKPTHSTSANVQPKLTALTVPTSAVPLELLRKYSSPKPLLKPQPPSKP
jgi:hypothetical protein